MIMVQIIFLSALDPHQELLDAVLLVKPDFEWNLGYMFAGEQGLVQ